MFIIFSEGMTRRTTEVKEEVEIHEQSGVMVIQNWR